MVSVNQNDVTCSVFGSITGADPGSLVRFVVGEDRTPQVVSTAEIASEFADPFATLLLGRGNFPTTAEELLAGIDAAVDATSVLSRSSQQSFLLGEGSQLGVGFDDVESTNSGLRFLVTRGSASHGPELIVSASHPLRGLVEIMAWDARRDGFNFYRNVGDSGEWAFAGNSRHALSTPTKGKGPFESHPSGNLLMKELKLPWVHWASFKVDIFASAFPERDVRRTHPWFTEHQGAETCERGVVMPSIVRWTTARFNQIIDASGTVRDPERVVEQILTCPTVNFTSSSRESASIRDDEDMDLPPTFFVDADSFALVGLPAPPPFAVHGELYNTSLETFAFTLRDHDGFERSGDTHFGFVVPERAFEDVETLRQAIDRGLVSKRLAAALLMVDFANPVFSPRRAALLQHAPSSAAITNGTSAFSDEMAGRINNQAVNADPASPEREFASLWDVGDEWPEVFASTLSAYYASIQGQLATQAGFDDYARLAESRRNQVRKMPIFEFALLFAETNVSPDARAMRPDGTVHSR